MTAEGPVYEDLPLPEALYERIQKAYHNLVPAGLTAEAERPGGPPMSGGPDGTKADQMTKGRKEASRDVADSDQALLL